MLKAAKARDQRGFWGESDDLKKGEKLPGLVGSMIGLVLEPDNFRGEVKEHQGVLSGRLQPRRLQATRPNFWPKKYVHAIIMRYSVVHASEKEFIALPY
jgi:hypothetical protein